MSLIVINTNSQNRKKILEILDNFPDDEIDYFVKEKSNITMEQLTDFIEHDKVSKDLHSQISDIIEEYGVEDTDVPNLILDLAEELELDEEDDEYEIEMDLIDEEGNIIDYTITFDYLSEEDYYDYDLYKEDFKIVRIFFDNGEVAEKEFMSKRYFNLLLENTGYFSDDVIVVDEIKIEKIFDIVDESIRDGVFEFIFDKVEKDFNIDEDFQNLSLN